MKQSQLNITQAINALSRFSDKEVPRALKKVINRTLITTRMEAGGEIRKDLNLKAGDIKPAFKITKAYYIGDEVKGALKVYGGPLPIIKFRPTVIGKGHKRKLRVRIKKKSGLKHLKYAFIATMGSGHTGVFSREKKNGKVVPRLPIKELFTTSIPKTFSNDDVLEPVIDKANKLLQARLFADVMFRLKKMEIKHSTV